MEPDDEVARATAHYAPADLTPAQFEQFVVGLLGAAAPAVGDLRVALHEKIVGVDGAYDFDATVRFTLGGMDFLVLVEAKKHKNPLKREVVQVLHDKLRSVGGHKGALISTAPFQKGALDYALAHGIALATVTEGRFTFETKSVVHAPAMTREQARARFGLPTFVAHAYTAGGQPGYVSVTTLDSADPASVASVLLGVAAAPRDGSG